MTPSFSSSHKVSGLKELYLSEYICVGLSSNSFNGINEIRNRLTTGTNQIKVFPLERLNTAIFFANLVWVSVDCGILTFKSEIMGATKNIVNTNAKNTPTEIPLPKSLSGATSKILKDKKPIQVVMVVKTRG